MRTKSIGKRSLSLLMFFVLLAVFLFPSAEPLQAFNQSNLIRVSEIREVDGQLFYRRFAPVTDMMP
ncbi:MAG: hypothetical protein KGZ54_01825 [Dethiobacter sp.]|nr:hypothetical protein [Dethiobacter sp.]MBS3900749.1 hypothetical protein [Dethiobacter sp.]MBS3988422.1 hypothetical protein [Dethiobacter sp.]